jgi:endonuclease-3 related protein
MLRAFYDRLVATYGPQHWWPADTATEVVIGAILTQNTAWRNVERAIERLSARGALDLEVIHAMEEGELADLIRPAGTYRVKAARLKAFASVACVDFGGDPGAMLDGEPETARVRLLAIHGIGPETADAILLYAADRPTFVVDAYTRRVLRRHRLIDDDATYESIRALFHESVEPSAAQYNEYHALLVAVGKAHCGKQPRCEGCPLADWPHDDGASA